MSYLGEFPDRSKLIARIIDTYFGLEAFGTRDSIAEVGEQLEWLSAAFSRSIYEYDIPYCTPFISDVKANSLVDVLPERRTFPDMTFKISCTVQKRQDQAVSPFFPVAGTGTSFSEIQLCPEVIQYQGG